MPKQDIPLMQDGMPYDFIDFGASKGGSIAWASAKFGGRGIGVDISPQKIERLRAAGRDGFVADAAALNLPDGSFRYATMMNFLEHLPNPEIGAAIIASGIRVARDFLFILGPNFDGADYLRERGLKKYFADWAGHSWHHTTAELDEILARSGHPYKIVEHEALRTASHRYLHPLGAARDGGPYDPARDPPKPAQKLRGGIYGWVTAVVCKNPSVDVTDILLTSLGCRVVPPHPTQGGSPGA